MDKISVLVPVYNAEKKLPRCLESIIQQEYDNIEIILVDDGSTDSSYKICEEWRARDNRIKLYHKDNGGAASARDFALKHATGDAIAWVDNDDVVHADMLLKMHERMEKLNADVVVCGFSFMDEDGKALNWRTPSFHVKCCSGRDAIREFITTNNIEGYCWNKLIKRSVYERADISYMREENPYYCDMMICLRIFIQAERVGFINEDLYDYYQNNGSMVHNLKVISLYDYVKAVKTIDTIVRDYVDETAIFYFYANRLNSCMYRAWQNRYSYDGKELVEWLQYTFEMEEFNINLRELFALCLKYRDNRFRTFLFHIYLIANRDRMLKKYKRESPTTLYL